MKTSEIKDLCVALAKAESEAEVIKIIKGVGLWDDPSAWADYDKNPNNFSTIGNQQSSPDTALVEKLINSVDAVLTKECFRRGIKPDSESAPQSIGIALKDFFGIYDGRLSSLDASRRTQLAENIMLVATGEKSNPCYTIIDSGEGQTPKRIPDTLLSLNKSNKLKIPFVQGKFNMGGAGALQFCSKQHNLQLIISKRDPKIPQTGEDATADKWGFTVVRREDPRGGMRSSSFRYLAPGGEIPMFNAQNLPLLPNAYPEAYGNDFESGTFIKLFEYQLTGYKTNIQFDLYNRLSMLLPGIALPVRLLERREGYRGHTFETTLSGLNVRLEEDKRDNLEMNFPSSSEMKIMGQEMKLLVYAFKKGQRSNYTNNEGVIFVVNGQAHGFLPQTFFERKSVGMSYIADSILVVVDCSKFDGRTREDLFMNSRDRLRDGVAIRYEIEKQIEELVKNHPGLRALREQRRREEIENKLEDSKPLAEVIEKIIKKSPALSKLFIQGVRIKNPFNLVDTKVKTTFQGKKFPSYFKLSKEFPKENSKLCPINRRFRVQFETDAENEYFNRDKEPGKFSIQFNEHAIEDFSLNLWNGLASLSVSLPEDLKIGDVVLFATETNDNFRAEPFRNEFYIKIGAAEEKTKGGNGGHRKPPEGDDDEEERKNPSSLDLPNMIELRKSDEKWEHHFADDADALSVKDVGDGSYDFYINMDNVHLQLEIKGNAKIDPRLLEARFKFGMVLIGISLLEESNRAKEEKGNDGASMLGGITRFARAISPVLLPMIASLGDLDLDI